MYGVRKRSCFIILHVNVLFSQFDAYFSNVKKNHLKFMLKCRFWFSSGDWGVSFSTKLGSDAADSEPGTVF